MKRVVLLMLLVLCMNNVVMASHDEDIVESKTKEIENADATFWLSKEDPIYSFVNEKIQNEEDYESDNIKLRFCNSVTLFIGHSMLVQAYNHIPDGIDVIAIGGANTKNMRDILRLIPNDIQYDRIVVWSMINDLGVLINEFSKSKVNKLKNVYDEMIAEARMNLNSNNTGSLYIVKETIRGDKPILDEYIYNMNRYITEYEGIRALEQKFYIDEEHSHDGIHYDSEYREEVFMSFLNQIVNQENKDNGSKE